MRVVAKTGCEDIAVAYVAETAGGKLVEFVESVQPPIPRHRKWVLIVSTLYGCPVACRFCDAGDHYRGRLTHDEIIDQIDYLVERRFPDRRIPVEKFKVQFARMGEPAHVQVEQIGSRLYGYHSSLLTPETTDYGKLFDALEAIGYKGDWVFEIEWSRAQDQCALLREQMAKSGRG